MKKKTEGGGGSTILGSKRKDKVARHRATRLSRPGGKHQQAYLERGKKHCCEVHRTRGLTGKNAPKTEKSKKKGSSAPKKELLRSAKTKRGHRQMNSETESSKKVPH